MTCKKDQPGDAWHLKFIMAAVCIQSIKESSEPHFRRHIIPQILEGSTLEMAARGFDELQEDFIRSIFGQVYHYEGRSKEAEELFVQVMEIRKSILVGEHPDRLECMNNLALVLSMQGKYNEAEKIY